MRGKVHVSFEGDTGVQTIPVTLTPIGLLYAGVLTRLVLVLSGSGCLTVLLCSDNFSNFLIIAPRAVGEEMAGEKGFWRHLGKSGMWER